MPISTTTEKNSLATKYGLDATTAALYSTVPAGAPGTELSGGSPAYARKTITWSAPSSGQITATVTFDVPSGATVAGAGLYNGSTFIDGGSVPSQTFGGQGTYVLTITFSQS